MELLAQQNFTWPVRTTGLAFYILALCYELYSSCGNVSCMQTPGAATGESLLLWDFLGVVLEGSGIAVACIANSKQHCRNSVDLKRMLRCRALHET